LASALAPVALGCCGCNVPPPARSTPGPRAQIARPTQVAPKGEVWWYDFGSDVSPVDTKDFDQVTPGTLYQPGRGFGWERRGTRGVDLGPALDAMSRDHNAVPAGTSNAFIVDLPDYQRVEVVVYLVTAHPVEKPLEDIWITIGSGPARQPAFAPNPQGSLGYLSDTVEVASGQLRLLVEARGQDDAAISAVTIACAACSYRAPPGTPVLPTTQPTTGPGGTNYRHADVKVSQHEFGEHAVASYWLYQPMSPRPKQAPVVAYLHGWALDNPATYDGLLRHLARKGYVVIFPTYGQARGVSTKVHTEYENWAIEAIKSALLLLGGPGYVPPRDGGIGLAGHSLGGRFAARIANRARLVGLPPVKAIIMHDQGPNRPNPRLPPFVELYPLAGLDQLDPAAILIDIKAGSRYCGDLHREKVVCDNPRDFIGAEDLPALEAYRSITVIPSSHRNFIQVPWDSHGYPEFRSQHGAVIQTPEQPVDVTDWVYWRLTTAALNRAFWGKDGEYVLGNSKSVKQIGFWSDGTPIRLLKTAADFGIVPR
jgi:dienelactone hydrolase